MVTQLRKTEWYILFSLLGCLAVCGCGGNPVSIPDTVSTPSINPNGGDFTSSASVTLTCATEGATIYYTTDGSVPTALGSAVYNAPIPLTATMTIKALAVKSGSLDSSVVTATFTGHVADPTFTPTGGDFTSSASVTLTCATDGATIYYTTDGSVPTALGSAVYSAPIPLTATTTVKAFAVKSGSLDSSVATATFTGHVADPIFTPAADEAVGSVDITITCATSGATIYYTTDGSMPTTASPVYSGSIHRAVATTVKAYAVKAGLTDSAVVSKTIAILPHLTRASINTDGTEGDASSDHSAISSDGNCVVFSSDATNLVDGDTNGKSDVFIRDRNANQTSRVSVKSDGTEADGNSYSPSVSSDGRYVAFTSVATNLVAGDTNAKADIFLRDRQMGLTTWVSVKSDGTQATGGDSGYPSISADGRYVAFESAATNLVDADTNSLTDVFLHDRLTGLTKRISVKSDGTQATGGNSRYPSISADGRYVVYESAATNLVNFDTNGVSDIFVYECETATTTRVSVKSNETQATGGSSGLPSISADGRYVAFNSAATNLVDGDTNLATDVFVHDRLTGQTTRVSVKSDGTQGDDNSQDASISADGRYVAFASLATNLVDGDTDAMRDIFVFDRQTNQTTWISINFDGVRPTGASSAPSISGDGKYISFSSSAGNLVNGDTNACMDIFVYDRGF
jgi:Tol biopolymer transport system component